MRLCKKTSMVARKLLNNCMLEFLAKPKGVVRMLVLTGVSIPLIGSRKFC